ncbi:hypothetical protein V495_07165 [Pseudogymnoascus sp. VKM F-4514 (FW-929)]|nr:hypothetical protein V495_07165 [Pseudogymnoascus sp. VKM F-4514 (FW-929)]KFY59582.1 hypothetical protein V497_04212 [Pseudogymnoascus sp. VKM F-4516 (FW-969)]
MEVEQQADPYSFHAHPSYAPPRPDLTSLPPLTIPRRFRLCNVSPEERTTWCMQTAYELALLKNAAFHYGDAYGKVVAIEETKLLLTNIIEMNNKGRSTLAAILEAMVGLEKTIWTVVIEEEVQNELASVVRFDGHCRARLMAMDILMEKIAETQQMIVETEQRAMSATSWGQTRSFTESSGTFETFSPEPEEVVYVEEGGANLAEGEMEAPISIGASDSQSAGTAGTKDAAPSETVSEDRTPRRLWRPQFGSMSLAEAENYSSWRGSKTI